MILRIEEEVPDNASPIEKMDKLLAAINNNRWREVESRAERFKKTDLTDKCGSCKYFKPMKDFGGSSCYGRCDKGRKLGQRSRPKCMAYERSEE